jgi:hypothetical protein
MCTSRKKGHYIKKKLSLLCKYYVTNVTDLQMRLCNRRLKSVFSIPSNTINVFIQEQLHVSVLTSPSSGSQHKEQLHVSVLTSPSSGSQRNA